MLLHIVFLSEFSLSLPLQNQDRQMLQMRIVDLQTVGSSVNAADKPRPEKHVINPNVEQIEHIEPPIQEKLAEEAENEPDASATPSVTPENLTSQTTQDKTAETIVTATETQPPETLDGSEETQAQDENSTGSDAPAYQYIETEFEVSRNQDTHPAGTATIVFKLSRDTSYSLTSTTEAKGLASLIFGTLTQTSEGTLTEHGLQPNYYEYRYGNDEKRLQIAHFAWSDGVVEMKSAKGTKTEKLIEGTQDLLSFMYQFMFKPPLTNMQITMTNGKNLRTYTYSFEGEKIVKTKLGDLKTIHLMKAGEDEEKTEIWLAVDYQYLPIKIRKTEKNGTVIEQAATKISTEMPQ